MGIRHLFPAGAAHPDWIGDAVTARGGRTRALRLFPVIGPCVVCGAPKTERHHIDGNTANNAASNIEALCRRCHMVKDGRLVAQQATALARQRVAMGLAAAGKLSRTHCKNGHPFTEGSWRRNRAGARVCRECEKAYKARYFAKRALRCQ